MCFRLRRWKCGLMVKLGVSINKTYFQNPVTDDKIYFFTDAPHLLKLVRNRLFDTGFRLAGGTVISKRPIEELVATSPEISSCHKLTQAHITCGKTQRQNVALAAQVLSHTTASALLSAWRQKKMPLTLDTIKKINAWFDIMNSYSMSARLP